MSALITTVLVPDDALVFEVAREAAARHLHLITDGHRHLLCSIVPPGWRRCAAVERDTHTKDTVQ